MTPLPPPSRALRALRRALAAMALTALFALPAPLFAQDTATLLANAIRTNGAGQLVAEGAVEILYRDRRLQATRVVYDRTGDRISLTGPITLTQGDSVLILADEAELDSELRDGLLRSARLVLDREMQVAAREIRRSEARYTEATDTVASSCEVCAANPVPFWQIRAKTVRHDQEERQLYFRNARLSDWLDSVRLDMPNGLTFPSDWTASFDWQYDLTADSTRAAGIGFAYRTECITVDLSLSRRFTSSANVQATTDFGLVVSLDGIGNRPASRSARRSCNG